MILAILFDFSFFLLLFFELQHFQLPVLLADFIHLESIINCSGSSISFFLLLLSQCNLCLRLNNFALFHFFFVLLNVVLLHLLMLLSNGFFELLELALFFFLLSPFVLLLLLDLILS